MVTISDIRERLTEIRPPGSGRDLISLGAVQSIDHNTGTVAIELTLPSMPQSSVDATVADIKRAIGAFDGIDEVRVHMATPQRKPSEPPSPGPLPGVRDIIAVSSAKGGVGKSTVATNLAVALAQGGRRIGLLDADVYGPSVPTMFGLRGRPDVSKTNRISPLEKFGLRVMSIGFFLDDNSPVIWRGPMVMGMIRQFLQDVEWGELDILVIDLPPGTGDTQLTLVQQVPLSGGIVVTTPQDVATHDVERGITMFEHVKTPILGVVENMSYFACPDCGERDEIFGSDGAAAIAKKHGVPLLGEIPLLAELRAGGDSGIPIVIADPEHVVSQTFRQIADKVARATEAAHADTAPPKIIL